MDDNQVVLLLQTEKIGVCRPSDWVIKGLSTLHDIFTVDPITTLSQVADFADQQIVWYRLNENNKSGWDIPGSTHYTISDFLDDIPKLRGHTDHDCNIKKYFKRKEELSQGLTKDMNIRVAVDTKLKQSSHHPYTHRPEHQSAYHPQPAYQ